MENFTSLDVAISFKDIEREIETTGILFANLDRAASALERNRTIFRMQLVLNYQKENSKLNRRDAETLALVSKEYADFLSAMLDARRDANIAKVNWQLAIAKHNGARTVESTRRAEMQLR